MSLHMSNHPGFNTSDCHWTVCCFNQDGIAKHTLYVYKNSEQVQNWVGGGKNWRNKILNIDQECYAILQNAKGQWYLG